MAQELILLVNVVMAAISGVVWTTVQRALVIIGSH
jgi:cell division protein FtsL